MPKAKTYIKRGVYPKIPFSFIQTKRLPQIMKVVEANEDNYQLERAIFLISKRGKYLVENSKLFIDTIEQATDINLMYMTLTAHIKSLYREGIDEPMPVILKEVPLNDTKNHIVIRSLYNNEERAVKLNDFIELFNEFAKQYIEMYEYPF